MSSVNETIKIKRQITIYVVVSLAAISIIVASVSLIPLYRVSRSQENKELSYLLSNRKMAVEEFLSKAENIASQVTSRTRIRQKLEEYNGGLISKAELVSFTAPKLNDAMIHSLSIAGICRLDKKGHPVVEVGEKLPLKVKKAYSAPLKSILVKTPESHKGTYSMVVAAPILNRSKVSVGIDLVLFDLSELKQIVSDSSNMGRTAKLMFAADTPDGYINVFPEKGEKNLVKCLTRKTLIQKAVNGGSPVTSVHEDEGREQVIACSRLKKLSWFLIMSIDKSELYLPVWQNVFRTAGFVIFLVLLGTAGIVFILRPLTGKMLAQVEGMEKEINILSGMIPICAKCKKIRSDEGYWKKTEEYIEANSEAVFSHSLCPECSDKLYGDEEWYLKKKEIEK